MLIRQWHVKERQDAAMLAGELSAMSADLVLVFGALEHFRPGGLLGVLRSELPCDNWLGCSTAGEIAGTSVYDHSLVLTALKFEAADSRALSVVEPLHDMADSYEVGRRLAQALPAEGLRAVLLLSVGVRVNGSALVEGCQQVLDPSVQLSGGLAGDAGAFAQTWTLCAEGVFDDRVVAIGLYGSHLVLDNSSYGGWEPFGPVRRVTRCSGNILYELDSERALDIYKRYLGDYAADLPTSGLLFPFEMLGADRKSHGVIRTLLGIDENDGSLTLAGDIDPQGYLRLMHASTDRLIDGAERAAQAIAPSLLPDGPMLALLVSCVGRRLVMGERIDEELEAVADTLADNVVYAGFYSNGEISEAALRSACRLYNQTMTITLIGER